MHLNLLRTRSSVTAGLIAVTLVACAGNQSGSSETVSASQNGGSSNGGSSGDSNGGSSGGSNSAAGDTSAGRAASAGASSSDLPCEVQSLLAAKCLACHSANPPGSLASSADFRRVSQSDSQRTVGELAVERVKLTTNLRMPPAPLAPATDAEIAALTAWVKSGAQAASCDQMVGVPPNPYDTPLVCTSMKNWTGGNRESPLMRPGGACISCHKQEGEGPAFTVAGTLFPTPHEPNDCNGVGSAAGAQIVITDANGVVHTLAVNQAGNFYLEARGFAFPYQAKVTYDGRERVMVAAQMSGDCNGCHTQNGQENAPGRIFLP